MLTKESPVREILASPAACAILDKYVPSASKDPKMKMAKMLTLERISKLTPDLSEEALESIDRELRELG